MADNKNNLPVCDREAARLLALQTDSSGRGSTGRRLDMLLCIGFIAALAIFAALHVLTPDRASSESENRTLKQRPEITLSSVLDGSFTTDFAAYLADQFPGRDFFITVKAASERVLGKKQNNGVLFGRNGTLVSRNDLPDLENLNENLDALSAFTAWCAEREIPTLQAVTGRTADVLDGTLPAYYGAVYSDRLWQTFTDASAARSIPTLNLRDPLRALARQGEYVYYRTDHHWTTLGAYYGYAAILEAMGEAPYPITDFTVEIASDAFYGTTWSSAGASWIAPDTMEYFRYPGDMDYTTTIVDDGTSFAGFYDTAYLEKKDKYSSFLSANHALVTVTKNDETERETLLVIKDSFAHAAAPLLARHYDLVIVDLRYYKMNTAALIDAYGVDRVLVLMNIDSLTASAQLRMLGVGLGEAKQ